MHASDLRRIALGMTGVIEGAHMGHPDFRVNNRIFATLHHDPTFGMVALTPEQQKAFIRAHPEAFSPESGAWGRAGSTRVRLAALDEETLGEVLTLARQNRAKQNPAKPSRAKAVPRAK